MLIASTAVECCLTLLSLNKDSAQRWHIQNAAGKHFNLSACRLFILTFSEYLFYSL